MCLEQFKAIGVEELAEFLETEINERAANIIREGQLSGAGFLLLEEADIKELWTVIGDRVHVKELWSYYKTKHGTSNGTVSMNNNYYVLIIRVYVTWLIAWCFRRPLIPLLQTRCEQEAGYRASRWTRCIPQRSCST